MVRGFLAVASKLPSGRAGSTRAESGCQGPPAQRVSKRPSSGGNLSREPPMSSKMSAERKSNGGSPSTTRTWAERKASLPKRRRSTPRRPGRRRPITGASGDDGL
jgi:hypothetical protein